MYHLKWTKCYIDWHKQALCSNAQEHFKHFSLTMLQIIYMFCGAVIILNKTGFKFCTPKGKIHLFLFIWLTLGQSFYNCISFTTYKSALHVRHMLYHLGFFSLSLLIFVSLKGTNESKWSMLMKRKKSISQSTEWSKCISESWYSFDTEVNTTSSFSQELYMQVIKLL